MLREILSPSHSTKDKNNFDSFGSATLSIAAQNGDNNTGDDFKRSVSFNGAQGLETLLAKDKN